MNVQLKNVKIHDDLSEETCCFTASIWVDGKRIGTVENRGDGGPNFYCYKDHAKGKSFEDYCRSLPPTDGTYGPLSMDEDLFVAQLLDQWETEKQLKKWRKGQVVFRIKGDKPGSYRTLPVRGTNASEIAKMKIQLKYGPDNIEEFHSAL